MNLRIRSFAVALLVLCASAAAQAQEPQPGARAPGSPAPPSNMSAAEKKYYELTKSKDPKTKGFAERYMNLLKFQEWGTASGKSVVAKYVSHDANTSKVKLAV